jgi:hypothetical protein
MVMQEITMPIHKIEFQNTSVLTVAISGLIDLMAKTDLYRKGAPSAKGQTGIQDTMRVP